MLPRNPPDFEEHINVEYVIADSTDIGHYSNRRTPKNHSYASRHYEDVNDNVKTDVLSPDSDWNCASRSVSEPNPPSDGQPKKACRDPNPVLQAGHRAGRLGECR